MKRSLWARAGVVFFVAFVLFSCRGPAETGPRLGVVLKALDSEFWLSVKDGAEKAAEELQVEITVLAPPSETDVEKQITIIEDLISQKVSGLAVSATDVAAVVPPLVAKRRAVAWTFQECRTGPSPALSCPGPCGKTFNSCSQNDQRS